MKSALTREAAEFVERRSFARYVLDVDVVLTSEVQEVVATACDVSIGGARVAAYRLLPRRTPIRVRLKLPQGVLFCDAEVRWVKPSEGRLGHMGIVWSNLSDLDRALLDSFAEGAPQSIPPASLARPCSTHSSGLRAQISYPPRETLPRQP